MVTHRRLAAPAALRAALVLALAACMHAPSPAFGALRCTDVWGQQYRLANASEAASLGLLCTHSGESQPTARALEEVPAPIGAPIVATASRGGGLALELEDGRSWVGMLSLEVRGRLREAGASPGPAMRTLIEAVARSHNHDTRLLQAIIHVESRFDPQAVSPKGAIGLMQVMPATAERMGVRDPQRALFDPLSNLHAGARYLRLLIDMFPGQLELAIAAYNAGEGAVRKYGRIPPYPETQAYVRRVMRTAGLAYND